MTKILVVFLSVLLIGCAVAPNRSHMSIIPSDEARAHPEFNKHFQECYSIAMQNQPSAGGAMAKSALVGAGISAATGLIMGMDGGYARLAGIGAAYGGLSSGAYTHMSNDQRYKSVMAQCLRDKGHNVY